MASDSTQGLEVAISSMSFFYQIIANGLHNGCLYAVLAYSYVLLFSVLPKPNLAHGAFFAFSGQVVVMGTSLAYGGLIFTFGTSLAFGLFASLVLSSIVVGFFAIMIVPRFSNEKSNMMIVVTLALAIVLMEAVRNGADGRDYWLPPLSSEPLDLGFGASITLIQAMNMLLMLLLLVAAEFILLRTSAGRILRAVSQEAKAAALCGVNVDRVVGIVSAAASGLAMFAGVLALLHFGNMSFGAGLNYGLKVLFIAAAGGFSTPRNAAISAFLFGEAEQFWDGYLPIIWREAVFYGFLSLLLILRGKA
jgi:branched-chain amino acid transport system permease protein